jgi:hypothetical protein
MGPHAFVLYLDSRGLAGRKSPADSVEVAVVAPAFQHPETGAWLVNERVQSDLSDALIAAFDGAALTR